MMLILNSPWRAPLSHALISQMFSADDILLQRVFEIGAWGMGMHLRCRISIAAQTHMSGTGQI